MSISPTTQRSPGYNSIITLVTSQANATVTNSETSSTSAQSTNTSKNSNSLWSPFTGGIDQTGPQETASNPTQTKFQALNSNSVWSPFTGGIDQTGPQETASNPTQTKFQALSTLTQQALAYIQGLKEAGTAMLAGIQNIVNGLTKVQEVAKNKTPGQEGDNNRGKDTRVAQETERKGKTDLFKVS